MDTTPDAQIVAPQLPPWVFQFPPPVDIEGTPTKDQLVVAIRLAAKAIDGIRSDQSRAPDFAADVLIHLHAIPYAMGPQQGLMGQLAALGEQVQAGRAEQAAAVESLGSRLDELVERVIETNSELADLKGEVAELGIQVDKARREAKGAHEGIKRLADSSRTRFKKLDDAVSALLAIQPKDRIAAEKRHNRAHPGQWVPVHNEDDELSTELPALEREFDIEGLDRLGRIAYLDFYGQDPSLEATDFELASQLRKFLIGL